MLLALTNMYIKYWWMVKSSIFKLCTTKYLTIYIHNLGYVEVLSENAIKSVNTIVCIPDLVIIKYFRNNTIEIKRIDLGM